MEIGTTLSNHLIRYLDLAVDKAKLTASNMANIDTPGYRTKGFDFGAEMQRAFGNFPSGKPALDIEEVDGLVSRPDGNNVSIDREGLNLADAQLKFRTGVALWRLENQQTMDAIHADK